MKSIIYIGMDVHKNTYSLCAIDSSTGEIIAQTQCAADVKNILKFIASIKAKLGNDHDLKCITGYEVLNRNISTPCNRKLNHSVFLLVLFVTALYFHRLIIKQKKMYHYSTSLL